MTDNNVAELRTAFIEALEKLASAVSWTMPNDHALAGAYLNEAWQAIDKLKEMIPDDR